MSRCESGASDVAEGQPPGLLALQRGLRPHRGLPGTRDRAPASRAQLRFTDADGWRCQVFLTDAPLGVVPGQLAGLEARHRAHARVEDRIRAMKTTGLLNFPCRALPENRAWLETRAGRHRPARLEPRAVPDR